MKRDEYLQKTKERIPTYDFDRGVFYLDYLGHRMQSRDISVFFIFSTTPPLVQFLNTMTGVVPTSSSSSTIEKETSHNLSSGDSAMITDIRNDDNDDNGNDNGNGNND